MWAEGQYLRLAQAMSAGFNGDTPSVVRAPYGGQVTGPIVADCNGTAAQVWRLP